MSWGDYLVIFALLLLACWIYWMGFKRGEAERYRRNRKESRP